MGTVLGIKKEVYDSVEAKFNTGFQIPPAGANIDWILTDFRLSSYTDKKTGEDVEYIAFDCKMTGDDGEEYKHGQFFRTEEEKDIQELKAFILAIGRADWNPQDDDLEELKGTKFKCDFVHYPSKNKSTGQVETKGRFDWKTIVPVNWIDGKPVDGNGADAEDDEEPVPRPKRRGRPAKKAEPEPEYDDDSADDDGDDEEEAEGFKRFSPRRTRRRRPSASDKD